MLEDNLLIVCPNNLRLKILKELGLDEKILNIKFMSKEEFRDNYFFKIKRNEALIYLMQKYDYDISVCNVYLDNLYIIEDNKIYKSPKLNFLKDLKKELLENNLLVFNPNFKNFLATRKLLVKGYYDLDKYEEEMLSYKVEVPKCTLSIPVTKCQSLEEEINYVALEIRELLKKGVLPNNIYLYNVLEEDNYLLRKIFSFYEIPLNLDKKEKIYGTKAVQDFLKNNKLNDNFPKINKEIISVLNDLVEIPSCREKDILLKDKLQKKTLSTKQYVQAVSVVNSLDNLFSDDDYVFVLGFNQDVLPKTFNDIEFIEDNIKDEVSLYKTAYLNEREKLTLIYLLSKIKNLYLSYKLTSSFNTFYKSFLIDELKLEEKSPRKDTYTYSNIYNKIRLCTMLDNYALYGKKDSFLDKLVANYDIAYASYDNAFTGINTDTYLKHLDYPLKLSYTKLNTYNECSFKYYLDNVLKLNSYTEAFYQFIGNMYHKILSLYRNYNFDLEKEYLSYLEKRDLSLKEKVLLVRIKKDLIDLIDIIKKQEQLTGYDSYYFEQEVKVALRKDIAVEFVGYIDKIMFYQKVDDAYFSIVDYKSGSIDTSISPLKYGLHMQLPIYLYLIHYGNIFSNPIFTGIYYQNILFDYPTFSKKLDKEVKERYYLNGYSTDDISVLKDFDFTYQKSELIKSLSYDEKGFGYYYRSKVISNELMYNLLKFTEKEINEKTNDILQAKFPINPKNYADKEDACKYCKYIDICFKKDKDTVFLEKVDDLSFLEVE